MSLTNLPDDPFQPIQIFSLSRTANNTSLLLINTIKDIDPINSLCQFENANFQDSFSENSLGIGSQCHNHSQENEKQKSTHILTPKKKKGGCTCKKTNCLKMYCQCFSMGKICTPECSCYGCFNHNDHPEIIENAKVSIKIKGSRRKDKVCQGCHCKKSQCQKKYCECFNAGRQCTQACNCDDCHNIYNQKGTEKKEHLCEIGEQKFNYFI